MSRHRPVSVDQHGSTYELPAVTVDSPPSHSVEHQSDSLGSPAIIATDRLSTTSALRNWSPPTLPNRTGRNSSPALASLNSGRQLRASNAFSSTVEDGKADIGPIPPLVKRAEKPRIPTKAIKTSTGSGTPTLAPPTAVPPPEERISPFSTPPSSEGSPTTDVGFPPPSNRQGGGSHSPPVHHSVIEKRREQPATPPYNVHSLDPRQHGFQSQKGLVGSPELRPGLPPRPGMGELGLKDFLSVKPASAPAAVAAETTSRSHPPPKRSTPSGSIQDFEDQRHLRPAGWTSPHQSAGLVPSPLAHGKSSLPRDEDSEPLRLAIEATADVSAGFPDFSETNRRKPYLKEGPLEIHTKYDTRLFDICGHYMCTTGYLTKVWDLQDRDQVMSMSHGETVKVTALAFKPGENAETEGKRLWLGTSSGEIHELDIQSQAVVLTKASAHSRREIIKIYRHQNEMWTLDDEGKLNIWPPDKDGLPNLQNSHISFKVPRAHSFSLIIADQLWFATGKDIRVFQPGSSPDKSFQVLQRPLTQPGVGDVTSGAVISSHLDRAYFGHADGKVTIYSTQDFACLGIVNVSVYKINVLAGAGKYLWAGYNTGMIYVYDTESRPWKVKKDWHAHEGPVTSILVDRSSIWKLGRLQVASLGNDNAVRIWDGMLEEDWLGRLFFIHCDNF